MQEEKKYSFGIPKTKPKQSQTNQKPQTKIKLKRKTQNNSPKSTYTILSCLNVKMFPIYIFLPGYSQYLESILSTG